MVISEVEKKMLSCPKCKSTYQEGTQRFCTNDGSRLVSSTAIAKAAGNANGVFTNLINRSTSNSENDEKISPNRSAAKPTPVRQDPPNFHTTFSSKVFKDENLSLKKDEAIQVAKPTVRLVKPNEIASGTAEVGDRQLNPTGRTALNWEKPDALLGQIIKGRYRVLERLSNDDSSISFLAKDRIIANKHVIVRVLMDEKQGDLLNKIFSEERVALSHMIHPNIVSVLDSGEILEGMPFVVTESVDGFSLKEKLNKLEHFNPSRTARIIRQAANALNEAHQNGILHRSLKPSNIFLLVSEVGTELVKVADFVVSNGAKRHNLENAKYLSPEQLEGRMPNFASDVYSMAVITYQMLTGKLPFEFSTADQLLKAQREGFKALPSRVKPDLPAAIDEVFVKALAYNRTERYAKARDFGDAVFHVLGETSDVHGEGDRPEPSTFDTKIGEKITLPSTAILIPSSKDSKTAGDANKITIEARKIESFDTFVPKGEPVDLPFTLGKSELAWEKRSPDPVGGGSVFWLAIAAFGLIALSIMAYLVWNQFIAANNEGIPNTPEIEKAAVDVPVAEITQPNIQPEKPKVEIESPPLARNWTQPENTEYFENTKIDAKGELAKNYRGFKLAYPKSWTKNESQTNFLDVSRKTEDGSLVEKMLVTYYNSSGLFSKDKEIFPKLVEKSNKDLKAALGDSYKVISQGETKIQNGRWNVYEVIFQSSGFDAKGTPITVWGRRFWLPTQNPTMRNGFVVTMLATSLSSNKAAEDVGNKDDLSGLLYHFEPSPLD